MASFWRHLPEVTRFEVTTVLGKNDGDAADQTSDGHSCAKWPPLPGLPRASGGADSYSAFAEHAAVVGGPGLHDGMSVAEYDRSASGPRRTINECDGISRPTHHRRKVYVARFARLQVLDIKVLVVDSNQQTRHTRGAIGNRGVAFVLTHIMNYGNWLFLLTPTNRDKCGVAVGDLTRHIRDAQGDRRDARLIDLRGSDEQRVEYARREGGNRYRDVARCGDLNRFEADRRVACRDEKKVLS